MSTKGVSSASPSPGARGSRTRCVLTASLSAFLVASVLIVFFIRVALSLGRVQCIGDGEGLMGSTSQALMQCTDDIRLWAGALGVGVLVLCCL